MKYEALIDRRSLNWIMLCIDWMAESYRFWKHKHIKSYSNYHDCPVLCGLAWYGREYIIIIFPTARLGFSSLQTCDLCKPSLALGKMIIIYLLPK